MVDLRAALEASLKDVGGKASGRSGITKAQRDRVQQSLAMEDAGTKPKRKVTTARATTRDTKRTSAEKSG